MMLFFRTFLISVPRFLVTIGVTMLLQYVDVSPLPVVTLTYFSYFTQFVLTCVFAKWAFYKRVPSWKQTSLVAVIFVMMEMVFESGLFILYFVLLRRDWSQVWQGYQWQTLWITVLYVGAVFLAAAHSRRHHAVGAIEGLER